MCEKGSCENKCNDIVKSQCPIVNDTLSRIEGEINKELSPTADTRVNLDSEPLLDLLSNKSRTGRSEKVQQRFRDQGGQ